MTLMHEVFRSGELHVNTLRLENHSNVPANGIRRGAHFGSHDRGTTGAGQHQGGEDAEHRGLPAPVRAKKSEDLCRTDFERDAL